jgi:hypothetical protein
MDREVAAIPQPKPLEVLLRIASTAHLYRSTDGQLHAQVEARDRVEMLPLRSGDFIDWLTDGYFAECCQPPPERTVQRIVALLKARARFDGRTPATSIRVARDPSGDDSAFYLDLGDATGDAIWISAEGWCIVHKPPVQFQRPQGQLALPRPSTGGSIELLRPYVNLNETDFRLAITWATAAYRPVGPYPVFVLHGEQGSAKTTLARILGLLIDPQTCPLLTVPESTSDLMITAHNGWLLSYDNVSILRPWLSDGICQLATGGGIAVRRKYTDKERIVVQAQRPVILNGIPEFVRRGDLIDRSVQLFLATILSSARRPEDEFWKAFRADYPRILGGMLDAIVGGLRELPSVHLCEYPRMADYAKWGEAVSRGLGWGQDTFAETYNANRREAAEPLLEESTVANAIMDMAHHFEEPTTCSPAELYHKVTSFTERMVARSVGHGSPAVARKKFAAAFAQWPKDLTQFSKELRRVAPQLRLHGLAINFSRTAAGRLVELTYTWPTGMDPNHDF